MSGGPRAAARRRAGWAVLAAALLWACLTPPDLPPGPFKCDRNGQCGDNARLSCVCELCCDPLGEPACPPCSEGPDAGTDAGTADAGGGGGGDGGAPDAGTDAGCVVPVPSACDTGIPGRCGPGVWSCADAGSPRCLATATPIPEVCNNADDDCNGTADDRPACGGPGTLLGPSGEGAGFFTGAVRTAIPPPNPLRTNCLKDQGDAGDSWDGGHWAGQFGGNNTISYGHILYAEPWDGGVWDLSQADLDLRLAFSGPINNGATPPFSYQQPQVFLCNAGTIGRRYEPAGPGVVMTFNGTTMTVNTVILLGDGGTDWRLASGTGFDLRQVSRVEVVLAPAAAAGAQPSFDATFTRWGFGP